MSPSRSSSRTWSAVSAALSPGVPGRQLSRCRRASPRCSVWRSTPHRGLPGAGLGSRSLVRFGGRPPREARGTRPRGRGDLEYRRIRRAQRAKRERPGSRRGRGACRYHRGRPRSRSSRAATVMTSATSTSGGSGCGGTASVGAPERTCHVFDLTREHDARNRGQDLECHASGMVQRASTVAAIVNLTRATATHARVTGRLRRRPLALEYA